MSEFFKNNWDAKTLEEAQDDVATYTRRLNTRKNPAPEWVARTQEKIEEAKKAVAHFSQ